MNFIYVIFSFSDTFLLVKKSKGKKKSAKLEAELSQNFVCRVGARCLTSGFWNVLRYFVLNGQLMTTLLPDYASILIENKQIVRPHSFSCLFFSCILFYLYSPLLRI